MNTAEEEFKNEAGKFPPAIGKKHNPKLNRPYKTYLLIFFAVILLSGILVYMAQRVYQLYPIENTQRLSAEARIYFSELYQDTWHYLATLVDEHTGMPYDSSAKQPVTSLSNAGLYLAATAIAYRTELISKEEASSRIGKCIDSLERVETWRGFPRPWILIRSLQPTYGEEFSYGSHLSNLLGGLIVAQNTFPEISSRIHRIIQKMDFNSLYDSRTGWLKGGYNVKTQNFSIFQSWGHWYYKYFASEIRLLSFYAVARQAIPRKHWHSLIRPTQTQEGETFFVSGQEEGGLFTQYLTGLFLDERNTEMGRSQKNYARFQMKHAQKIHAPVWGWSSSESPDRRYLAYGELQDEVVTPYASILASIYYPRNVYENLKKLEGFGAKPAGGQAHGTSNFGFRDSVNWKTGEIARNYLTPSQAMVFLSLANLLYDGVVWKSFREDPVVERGLAMIHQT